jgi:hypothetical protein
MRFVGFVQVELCKTLKINFIYVTQEKSSPKDGSKGCFGVIQQPVAIIENTDAIPKLGILLDAGWKRGNVTLGFRERYGMPSTPSVSHLT